MKQTAMLLIILAGAAGAVWAGDNVSHAVTMSVTEVSVIGLDSTAPIALDTTLRAGGGVRPEGNSDASKTLWYTSVVPSGGKRRLTVNWGTSDRAPAGTSLLLRVTSLPERAGRAAGAVRLSGEPQAIITDIGSCATGADPVGLLYTFRIDDADTLIRGETSTVVVNFTLTDAF